MATKRTNKISHVETDGETTNNSSHQSCAVDLTSIESYHNAYMDYINLMPSELQETYIDAAIICSPEDREAASDFKNHLSNDIRYKVCKQLQTPKVELVDNISGNELDPLKTLLRRTTFVFLFLTKSFCGEQFKLLISIACLMETLSDENRKWSVIPVHTKPKSQRDYQLPIIFSPVKSIEYLRVDQFYKEGLIGMFTNRAHERLRKERDLNERRKNYYDGHINEFNEISDHLCFSKIEPNSPVVGRAQGTIKKSSQPPHHIDLNDSFDHSMTCNLTPESDYPSSTLSSQKCNLSNCSSCIAEGVSKRASTINYHFPNAKNVMIGDSNVMTLNKEQDDHDDDKSSFGSRSLSDDDSSWEISRPPPINAEGQQESGSPRSGLPRLGVPELMKDAFQIHLLFDPDDTQVKFQH